MEFVHLSHDELARYCEEETGAYRRGREYDPRYCFELLRRGLAGGAQEALAHIYRIYESQIRRWVYQHSGFEQADETSDYFVSVAFSNFYFALQGEKFNRFSQLPQLFAYLKMCVHTAIARYLRDYQRLATIPIDDRPIETTTHFDEDVQFAEIWELICGQLPDLRDQRLAHLVFAQDLKPAEIVERYPDDWESPRAVSVALQRIRRILRKDPQLRSRMGLQ